LSNGAVTGQVLDENGAAQAGLIVGAYDTDGLFGDRLLANTTNSSDPLFADYARTAADGGFSLSYAPGTYNLQVRVYDTVKRQLAAGPVATSLSSASYALPAPITVTQATATGWLATGGQFSDALGGNSVDLIVDNHVAWQQIVTAVAGAKVSVNFMLFFLDVGITLMEFVPDMPNIEIGTGQPTPGLRLESALATAGENGAQVRLLCNDFTAFSGLIKMQPFDSAARVAAYFSDPPATNVEVRPFATPLFTPIHTKFVVIDNTEAFIIGSPYIQDYYDEYTHLIADPRHGDYNCVSASQIQVPTHDVSLHLTGPAIGELNQTFCLHWNQVAPAGAAELPADPAPAPAPSPNASVQVTRTLNGNSLFPSVPQGETTIVESYLRAIKNAQNYIYLENQYFTCDPLADALILALKQAPGLQLIFLTNNKVDIPGYSKWQPATIRKVLGGLTATERERVGFFTLWSHEAGAQPTDPTSILRNYVHSKVAIVDDMWATVGSANLDGVSLTASDNASASRSFWYWLLGTVAGLRGTGDLTQDRASETNLMLLNGIASQPATTLPADLRCLLWAEHLGLVDGTGAPDPANAAVTTPPAGGWLQLWSDAAAAKVTGLTAQGSDPITLSPARILPYPVDEGDPSEQLTEPASYPAVHDVSNPGNYLSALGVDTTALSVLSGFPRFSFQTSDWVNGDPGQTNAS
jgi:phosphatidylserine/phosphatidylglycerophosphate/cardiolipin synthase-like enzyme